MKANAATAKNLRGTAAGKSGLILLSLCFAVAGLAGCTNQGGDAAQGNASPAAGEMPPLPRNVGEALLTGKRPKPQPKEAPKAENSASSADDSKAQAAAKTSAEALEAIKGKELLAGDLAISKPLVLAVQENRAALYRVTTDYPFSDGAAMAVSQEAKAWIQSKMSAFGFEETTSRPDLLWLVHVDPGEDGTYVLDTSIVAAGKPLFAGKFVVPAQVASDRMERVFSEKFAPGRP